MNKAYLLFIILALSACGRNDAQSNGQNVPECKNTQEQVDAQIELIRSHKLELLTLLRSQENKDNKVSGLEKLYSEVKSFNAANNAVCRDPDGTGRSANAGDNIEELLLAGIEDAKSDKPVASALVSELDPGAIERQARALELSKKIPDMLKKECGLELTIDTVTDPASKVEIKPISTTSIDDAVGLATNSDSTKAETVTLWKVIESLNNVTFLISDDFIDEINIAEAVNPAKEPAANWSAVRDYLKTLSNNLTEIMNHVDDYRKDSTKNPAVWPAEIKS